MGYGLTKISKSWLKITLSWTSGRFFSHKKQKTRQSKKVQHSREWRVFNLEFLKQRFDLTAVNLSVKNQSDHQTDHLRNGERPPHRVDIARQAQQILEQAAAMFAGGSLTDEDKIAFMDEIQSLYLDSKRRAKKFTPKKYRKND